MAKEARRCQRRIEALKKTEKYLKQVLSDWERRHAANANLDNRQPAASLTGRYAESRIADQFGRRKP